MTLARGAALAGLLALLGLMVTFVAAPAAAQDSEVEVARQVSGPYDITVYAQPPQPVAGLGTRLSVRVMGVERKFGVTTASVQVTMTSPKGEALGPATFFRQPDNPGFYSSLITLGDAGQWQYTIAVQSEQGLGTVDGVFQVRSAQGSGATGTLTWGIVMVVLAIGFFLAWASLRRKRIPHR